MVSMRLSCAERSCGEQAKSKAQRRIFETPLNLQCESIPRWSSQLHACQHLSDRQKVTGVSWCRSDGPIALRSAPPGACKQASKPLWSHNAKIGAGTQAPWRNVVVTKYAVPASNSKVVYWPVVLESPVWRMAASTV